MNRLIQPRLTMGLFALALGLPALLYMVQPSPGQVPKNLPEIEPLKHEKYTEKCPDSDVTFDMVPIPGGIFMMGSPAGEKGRKEDEGPQHPVKIKPFWMGKLEVTWEEYDVYWRNNTTDRSKQMENKPSDAITTPTPPYGDETRGFGRDGKPALQITQHAAMEYCYWLSVKTGKKFRLPTEAEWEWACRAGTTTAYFFGDDSAKLGDYAWSSENSNDEVHKVGQKSPNKWGLYDICGNVAEWCVDHYAKDYYKEFPLDKLALWPVKMPDEKRYSYVARGGGWSDDAALCRSAARVGSSPKWLQRDPQRPQSIWWMTDAEHVGFRVVRMVDEDYLKDLRSKVTFRSPDD